MIQIQADMRTRALIQCCNQRSHHVNRHQRLVNLGMLDDNRITCFLRHVHSGADGLKTRGIYCSDRHIVLFGDVADISHTDEHLFSFPQADHRCLAFSKRNILRVHYIAFCFALFRN